MFDAFSSAVSEALGGGEIVRVLRLAGSAWLVGAAIKAVDAAVDGEPGWDAPACAAYAAALLALACSLDAAWAASLMASAWVLGMLHGYGGRGRLEGLVLLATATALLGWREVAGSGLVMLAVQLVDGVEDRDGWMGRAGTGPRLAISLVALAVLTAAALVDPLKAGVVVALVPAAEALGARLGRRAIGASGASWVWSS
ncbi:hypothetical protein [Geochorda subterranea]|uniref:Uncharacterized protein n=1 Tax=Geochorda subterranea TaxID=3109564 RepID=A0ABZ1BL91_9FIRM|nr:hypothetical protein [Limnochorda sp. LNt]WRP13273.1 hypothetical protein VLY81_07350 [Limnochorda sp. LNt]